jgi:hypothetical protein
MVEAAVLLDCVQRGGDTGALARAEIERRLSGLSLPGRDDRPNLNSYIDGYDDAREALSAPISRDADVREAIRKAKFEAETTHGIAWHNLEEVSRFELFLAALSLPADGWRTIDTCEAWRFDHMNTMLANWISRGVCETYWDEDEAFDTRPVGWPSPRCGWRSPGDQCIPVNQSDVTHWRPLPTPPISPEPGK